MAIQHQSDFTGTSGNPVTGLSPAVGTALTAWYGSQISTNGTRAYNATGNNGGLVCGDSVGSANYVIKATVVDKDGVTSPIIATFARYVDSDNYYAMQWTPSAIRIFKRVATVDTTLGTWTRTRTVDVAEVCEFVVNGSSLSLWVDGVQRIAPVTDTAFASEGGKRLNFQGATSSTTTTGPQLDQFTVNTDFPSAAPTTRRRPTFLTTPRTRQRTVSRIVTRTWAGPPRVEEAAPGGSSGTAGDVSPTRRSLFRGRSSRAGARIT